MSALSKTQKSHLAQLAGRAFNLRAAIARGRGEDVDTTTAARSAWRHDQVAAACGKDGLRCCSQDDYRTVEAHFLNLLNEPGRALQASMAAHDNDWRVAKYKVTQALARWGLDVNYAATILRGRGLTFDTATSAQLWQLLFTLNNRGAAQAKKARVNKT